MKLKDDKSLEYSSTVANNKMNRQRQLIGINSYEEDLQYDIVAFLEAKFIQVNRPIRWLDVCCGEGRALLQASQLFATFIEEERLKITGLDLVNYFHPKLQQVEGVDLYVSPINTWQTSHSFDLITVVHGFHYIGDKLATFCKLGLLMEEKGLLLANFDTESIAIKNIGQSHFDLKKALKLQGIYYDNQNKILRCEGSKNLNFPLLYQGGDDTNYTTYTGMKGVKSYYSFDSKFL